MNSHAADADDARGQLDYRNNTAPVMLEMRAAQAKSKQEL